MELIAFTIERREKRNPLNMVPVIVRNENVCFGISLAAPAAAEWAQARATIENELRPVWGGKLKARRVAAIAPGRGIDCRRGPANAPEAELRDGTAPRIVR